MTYEELKKIKEDKALREIKDSAMTCPISVDTEAKPIHEETIATIELDTLAVLGVITDIVNDLGVHIIGPEEWVKLSSNLGPDSYRTNVLLNNYNTKNIREGLEIICKVLK